MASTVAIRRRTKSVRNTRQITKAMQLVAASKMRRAQDHAVRGHKYQVYAHSLLTRLSMVTEVKASPLYQTRPVSRRLYIIVTSNSGLAGAYNANILRMFDQLAQADRVAGVAIQAIAIGKKGAQFVHHTKGVDLLAVYTELGDHPEEKDIQPILAMLTTLYRDKEVDEVCVLFTQFKSNLVQQATRLPLLPIRLEPTDEPPKALDNTTFEPSLATVLATVTERLLQVQFYQAILESIASEQSMRMIAMKNATDNATDIIDDLTLAYNTARQAAITQELAEITGGAEALA